MSNKSEPVACIHCGGKGYWKGGLSSETFVCLCQITDTDAVFDKCPKYPTAPLNTLDADTTTRMRLVLDKLGIENKHFEDLPSYLFVLLGQARREIESLQNAIKLLQQIHTREKDES
jgi:hypothetical protein